MVAARGTRNRHPSSCNRSKSPNTGDQPVQRASRVPKGARVRQAYAEAICEAVTRPTMRFVETKTPEQQSCLILHRTRHLFIRQQTAVINAIRAHLPGRGE